MPAGHQKFGITDATKAIPVRDAIVRLHPRDQIALAKMDLPGGVILIADAGEGALDRITLCESIPSGHGDTV